MHDTVPSAAPASARIAAADRRGRISPGGQLLAGTCALVVLAVTFVVVSLGVVIAEKSE